MLPSKLYSFVLKHCSRFCKSSCSPALSTLCFLKRQVSRSSSRQASADSSLKLISFSCRYFPLLKAKLEAEYQQLGIWYFVSFIFGIIFYFSLAAEPPPGYIISFAVVSFLLLIIFRKYLLIQFLSGLLLSLGIGILVGKMRVANLESRSIKKTIITELEGNIESVKPVVQGMQLVLTQVTPIPRDKILPDKIRINIPAKYGNDFSLNDKIKVRARLYKLQNNILPGTYDFGFFLYLAGIGASGNALSKPVILIPSIKTKNLIYKVRKIIYDRLVTGLGSINGNFAAAILLGETKGIKRQVMNEMRLSGISHILCVSGLHLSLVALIFFVTARFLLNLSDFLAFNCNIKLISSIISLTGSYGYLELSGMQVAATRAFIMTSIFILSVIFGRSPYPQRSIAIAAGIILCLNPEYIFHPSFQLSFIAVLSLIVGFEFFIKYKWILGESKGIFAAIKFYLISNIYSSFLASVMTAPVVINQFYIFSTYSIPMNLIAVPIMSFFLMPIALVSIGLMLFGLEGLALKPLGFFINIITYSAKVAVNSPASVWYFGHITPFSIIMFVLGFFWLSFWQTGWRLFGLVIMALSATLMLITPKPDLIFDYKSRAIGIKNAEGKLEIYAEKMWPFNRTYWANWFGQEDAVLIKKTIARKNHIFVTESGRKIAINYNGKNCLNAEVQININRHCLGRPIAIAQHPVNDNATEITPPKIIINRETLDHANVLLVYCNSTKCRVQYDTHQRFNFDQE